MITRFQLRLVNLGEVKRGHAKLLKDLERATHEAAQTGARTAQSSVKNRPGFKPRTGKLQRGTKTPVRAIQRGTKLLLLNNVKYAAPIEYGSRPHKITARRAKALRFAWPRFWSIQTRSPVWFLRSVNHPGNRPYKFLYRAWRSASRTELRSLQKSMARIASRF